MSYAVTCLDLEGIECIEGISAISDDDAMKGYVTFRSQNPEYRNPRLWSNDGGNNSKLVAE